MKEIVGSGGSPLFGHLVVLEIKELANDDAEELYVEASNATTAEV